MSRSLADQIKLKQQEVAAWKRVFADGRASAEDKQKASASYMLASQELEVLRRLAKTLDVTLPSRKQVELNVTQQLADSRPSLINELEARAVEPVDGTSEEERLCGDFAYLCAQLEIPYRAGLNPRHPHGGFGPFELASGQRKLTDLIVDRMLINQEPLRLCILKSRQLGCTTLFLAFWVWLLTRIPHFHVFFMIDVGTHAVTKRNTVLKWIDSLNKKWPHIFSGVKRGGRTDKIITLTNESILFIDSAESTNPGTSEMLHVLHTSEKPKWVKGRARMIKESVEPGLPVAPMTCSVDESTACGLEEFYYTFKQASEDPDSNVLAVFLPWFISNECQLPVDGNFEWSDRREFRDLDPDTDKEISEQEYAIQYGLTKEQILWRRFKIMAFNGNRSSFDQEYPTSPAHAFRQMSDHFFPKAMRIRSRRRSEYFRGYLDDKQLKDPKEMKHYIDASPFFVASDKGPLFVRELPVKGEKYYIGGDVAEGKTIINQQGKDDPDYTVFCVKDSRGRTVAIWLGRISPEDAWLPLLLLAVFYNMATVNGERNNQGYTLLAFFWRTSYPNNLIESTPKERTPKERAWTNLTGDSQRDDMLKQLRSLWARYPDSIFNFYGHEESIAEQVGNFVKTFTPSGKVKYKAAIGFHDDIIMAEAHAYLAVAYGEGEDVYKYVLQDDYEPEPEPEPEVRDEGMVTLADTDIGFMFGGSQADSPNGYSY